MTEKQILQWIKDNLSAYINRAIREAKVINPCLLYTEDWLAAMVYRETGFLIARYVKQGHDPIEIHQLMKGDYGQRPGEAKKIYHGYSYFQIDIASYPDFISSGKWKDPYLSAVKSISVLEEKRIYLQKSFPKLSGDQLERAITAAYNSGQGNVSSSIKKGRDVDYTTHQKNYSKEVWRFRETYKTIQ